MEEHASLQPVYDSYAFMFALPFSIQRKSVIFSALLAGEPWSWRVIGITEAALEALSKRDFRYVGGTVCRAHIVDRFATANAIFGSPSPLGKEDFFKLLFKNGRTIITTKSENKSAPRLPKFISIDGSRGLFKNKLISYVHGKNERAYLRKLYEDLKSGSVQLSSIGEETHLANN